MATSTMAEALAASIPAPQAPVAAPVVTAAESIPASMSKLIDIEAEIPLRTVQLDSMVVMKIIKHSQEARMNGATGLLLGIDLDGVLEVSNCFPLPPSSSAAAESEDDKHSRSSVRYQASMLRSLKDIQRDDNVVGFYQSCSFGNHISSGLVEMQTAHRGKLRHGGIVIVHDTTQSAGGNAEFRAFRLTENFLDVQKQGRFSTQFLMENGLKFSSMFEELPVVVRTSPLVSSYVSQLVAPISRPDNQILPLKKSPVVPPHFAVLDLHATEDLHDNLELIIDKLDEYKNEESNVAFMSRQIAREKARAEAYATKRKDENAMRVSQGLAPLPEEDISRLFKIPSEPNRLESMLLLGELDKLSRNLERESAETLVKSYAARNTE